MIIMRDNVHSKCMNALQQVTAREGKPIIFCEKGDIVSLFTNKYKFDFILYYIIRYVYILLDLITSNFYNYRKHKNGQIPSGSLKFPRQ